MHCAGCALDLSCIGVIETTFKHGLRRLVLTFCINSNLFCDCGWALFDKSSGEEGAFLTSALLLIMQVVQVVQVIDGFFDCRWAFLSAAP